MSLKIAIDARWIFEKISGIGEYTTELIYSLSSLPGDEEYIVVFNNKDILSEFNDNLGNSTSRVSCLYVPWGIYHPLSHIFLSGLLKKKGVKVFHSPGFMIPFYSSGISMIVTIHDLIPIAFPEFTPKAKKTRFYPIFKWIVSRAVSASDQIIVVSENSKRDLLKFYNLREEKVNVVYNGVGERFLNFENPKNCTSLKEKHSIEGPMILYIGRRDPYKNLEGLIRAFYEMKSKGPGNAVLVIAGDVDSRYPEPERLVNEFGLKEDVFFTGYISNEDVLSLYSEADVLAVPSLYEGFGLQILEAFAMELPVVASNTSSIPEVAGDASILVSPENTSMIADALSSVLTNDDIRKDLIEKGKERVKSFSWNESARKTLNIYRCAAKEKNI